MVKVVEAGCAARGEPSPLAPQPAPDHLDLTRPFDAAGLLEAEKEACEEWKASAPCRPY
jgi:hypothetical protein